MKLESEFRRQLLFIIAIIFMDQGSKFLASILPFNTDFSLVGISLHHNYGAILGLGSQASPIFRVVTFSTFGAFVISLYALAQYLIPNKSLLVRSGLSFLLAGILGNVIDRSLYGYAIDFLSIGLNSGSSIVLNLADIAQWIGYLLIARGLYVERKDFWREDESRNRVWINPIYQTRYCLKLLALASCYSVTLGVFSVLYLKHAIEQVNNFSGSIDLTQFILPFVLCLIFITAIYFVVLVFFGIIESHKTAGPIFSFENYVKKLMAGEDGEFQLRSKDEFKNIEELARALRAALKK